MPTKSAKPGLLDELKGSIPLASASEFIPGNPHATTIQRWATTGIRGVRLETWRVGAKWLTTISAIEKFIAATSNLDPSCECDSPRQVAPGSGSRE